MTPAVVARKWFPRFHSRVVIARLVRDALREGEPELRLVGALASRRGVFVDVGANRGIYSFVARRHGLRAVAVEPNPELAAFIRAWADERVDVLEASASDRAGTVTLEIPVDGGSELDGLARIAADASAGDARSSARRLAVAAVRLDDLDLREIAVLKIDVEGHELEVLAGAARTLAQHRPAVIVEVEDRHRAGAIAAVRGLLEQCGYRGFFLDGGRCRPIDEFRAERHQNAANIRPNGTRSGIYLNNFVYLPAADSAERAARLDAASRSYA